MIISSVLLLFALLSSAQAAKSTSIVLEARQAAPSDFISNGQAPADAVLDLRIALAQSDMAGLEKELYAVSEPDSERYGLHLSKSEVQSFMKPTNETLGAVNSWLDDNGISSTPLSSAGDWIKISVPVAQANKLLNADFTTFTSQEDGQQTIRTLSYSIPSHLQEHIDFIHPTVMFPLKKPTLMTPKTTPKATPTVRNIEDLNATLASAAVPASCATQITPTCLVSFYGIPTTAAKSASNSIAVAGYEDQFAIREDLQLFLEVFRPDISPTTSFDIQLLDGGTDPQAGSGAGFLANTDVQYTVGIATGVTTQFISVGPSNTDGIFGFMDLAEFLLDSETVPGVLTLTYGSNEPSLQASISIRLCNNYMALGVRGVSIIVNSGDGGVSGTTSQTCSTFIPTFPSTCPFVTSVGGTAAIRETAAGFSSGGFSSPNFFPVPTYQTSFTKSYQAAIGTLNKGLYNPTGRGFPDVSVQSEDFSVIVDGDQGFVDGTEAGAAVFGSVITLLNDALVSGSKNQLGFLNPMLYNQASGAFNDITTGNNPGCNTNGFPARNGWDPITGLGTPNWSKLSAAVGLVVPV